jgi:solute carrier family 25 protein 44
MYSALTVALHPLTVAKIRRQVARSGEPTSPAPSASGSRSPGTGAFLNNIGQYYRGLGVVIALAIPARIIYISTLEYSREQIDANARHFLSNPPSALATYSREMLGLLPMVTPFSGGIAGGLAAVSSQIIVVPMDVLSQKMMVMEEKVYQAEGSAVLVARKIILSDGWRGLYRGFGLSLFTSLPAGTIWWGTYVGFKDKLSAFEGLGDDGKGYIPPMARQVIVQVASAFSAAVAASLATQPLDTIKTRLQVGVNDSSMKPRSSLRSFAKEFVATPGLYKGLLPRIVHMGVWGSVLSAAYEVLKLVSRKDYDD